jgi:hypothetical protein
MGAAVATIAAGCVLAAAMRLAPTAGAAQAAGEDRGPGIGFVQWIGAPIAPPRERPSLDVGDGSWATSVGLDSAEVVGDAVRVVGKGAVYEPRPNTKYLWGVRILNPANEETVLEKLFFDSILAVPDDGNLSSDFDGLLELPFDSGDFILELAWYAVPPDTGLEGLDVPSIREFNRCLGGRAEISLGR